MLTDKEFIMLEQQASELYANLENDILKEIADRIIAVGEANTVVLNNVQILKEMGLLNENIIYLISSYTGMNEDEILDIFNKYGILSVANEDKLYAKYGITGKRGLSNSMKQVLEATAKRTNNNLTNLCLTTAKTSQIDFINNLNNIYMQVSTGSKSYSQALVDTLKNVAQKGVQVEYKSGRKMSLEAATRMNLLTSVNQMSAKLQLIRAEDYGQDLVEVTAHGGARPEHAEWQGKVYSIKGITKGYKTLEEGCDYGKVTGLCGVNCRHTFMPFFKEEIRTYTDKDLEEINNQTITYNNEEYTEYEISQIQRKFERTIRQNKKDLIVMQQLLQSNDENIDISNVKADIKKIKANLNDNNKKLNSFLNETGRKKDNSRLVI